MAAVGGAREDGNEGQGRRGEGGGDGGGGGGGGGDVAWRYREIQRDIERFNELRRMRACALAWTSLAVLAAMAEAGDGGEIQGDTASYGVRMRARLDKLGPREEC